MMYDLLLIGAGGHCRSCIDVIEQEGRFEIAGIVDKVESKAEVEAETKVEIEAEVEDKVKAEMLGYPIIGTDDDLPELRKKYTYALVTVGQIKSPDIRIKLFKRLLELGFELPTIISPMAYVSRHAKIDQGTIIMHHALVNAGAHIGQNCIINTKALIEHDAVVEDHCHIATGAVVNGQVRVGEGSFLGSNAECMEGVVIGKRSVVGLGMSLSRDVLESMPILGEVRKILFDNNSPK